MTRRVDLRSDTVTSPTPAMREAMARAEVGDDGFGEDPTVVALEARYAELVGKEAALFVPSGVMANQIALRVLTRPGDVVVAGRNQHVVDFEMGAAARNASVQFATLDDEHGVLDAGGVAEAIGAEGYHRAHVSLVCVENTHMPSGGTPWDLAGLAAIADVLEGRSLHMDGARLFNAVVATGISAADYARFATTVMSCLSKGLCAPVGSVLAGSSDVIATARVERKRLGGAMRQAGVLAAAGLVALEEMVSRLGEDHRRARVIAEAVALTWPESNYDPESCRTNIVAFTSERARDIALAFSARGILCDTVAANRVRLVTHHDIDDDDVDYVNEVITSLA
jgi:threonine aldolase